MSAAILENGGGNKNCLPNTKLSKIPHYLSLFILKIIRFYNRGYDMWDTLNNQNMDYIPLEGWWDK